MSRLTGNDAKDLMEAYSAVYTPQQELTEEQIWEEVENWVNSLLEEGYDLSEYTWEEMYEEYLNEMGQVRTTGQTSSIWRPTPGAGSAGGSGSGGRRGSGIDRNATQTSSSPGALRVTSTPSAPARTPAAASSTPAAASSTPAAPARTPAAASSTPAAPARTPGSPSSVRPATAAAAPSRPAAPAATQTGDKAKDMATWAKANPKLAAAAAEKSRIRGTQQTDNPLMKDMKSRLPMNSPSVQAPAVSSLGKGNQSLTQNPNAFKAATPSKAVAAAPSTSASASGSVAPATAKIAAASKPTPVAPRLTPRQQRLNMEMEHDAFDLVLEYLLSQGHVDTLEEALYVMMEMNSETIQDIVELHAPPPIMPPPPVNAPPKPASAKKKPSDGGASGITFGKGETPKGPVGKGGKPMD